MCVMEFNVEDCDCGDWVFSGCPSLAMETEKDLPPLLTLPTRLH